MIEQKSLLDVRVDKINCTLEEALQSLSGKKNQLILTLDMYQLLKVKRNKKLKEIVKNAALVIPSSPIIAKAYNFINRENIFYKKDLLFFSKLLSYAELKKISFFLFGSEERYFFTIMEKIKKIYPTIHIVGSYQDSNDALVMTKAFEGFKKIDPNLFIIYMDFKKSLLWFNKNKDNLDIEFCIPIKKPLDIFAGKGKIPELAVIEANKEHWFYLKRNIFNIFKIFTHIHFWNLVIIDKLFFSKKRKLKKDHQNI